MKRLLIPTVTILLLIGLPIVGVFALVLPDRDREIRADVTVFDALGGRDSSAFVRAVDAREFSFPRDHSPHPEYAVEWWYYTGNLDTADGRHFGYELTFFRIGLDQAEAPESDSDWRASQAYMAHFGLTDVESRRFYSFERLSREALGLAGTQEEPFRVWLEDWSLDALGDDFLPLRLTANDGDVAIDLVLDSTKPIVLQGDNGLSRKGDEEGNASYYYSMTRMQTDGTVSVGGQAFEVSGESWMDREWSTTALAENQVGWDWFALQLSDGRDVMFYQLRQKDGGSHPNSSGTLVFGDGSKRHLVRDDVQIEVLDQWQSSLGDARYPSRWRLTIPSESIELTITPYIANQEMDVSVRYWEGAVHFEGTANGNPVSGNGYVEMTGYTDEAGGRS